MLNYFLLVRPQGPLFSFHSRRLLARKSVVSLLTDAARQAGLPKSSLMGIVFVSVLPLLLLLQAYQIG